MLGYVCKYTPVEVFTSMGIKMKRIEPDVAGFHQAETLMHPNVCSYAKAVLEAVTAEFDSAVPETKESAPETLEGIIFTTCCDSIRRLYDTLCSRYPDKFFYMLDVPRKVNDFAGTLFAKRIQDMINAYEEFSGKHFSMDSFQTYPNSLHSEDVGTCTNAACSQTASIQIGVMGARCNKEVLKLLSGSGVSVLFDMTCTGISRDFLNPDSDPSIHDDSGLADYAFRLLNQIPCMRMLKAADRSRLLDGFTDRLDGILYHTVKFCDNYSFEYADLKQSLSIPILAVETDCTAGSSGQLKTRVEAFIEELSTAKKIKTPFIHNKPEQSPADNFHTAEAGTPGSSLGKDRKMYILGIDSGSTSTNAVIMNEKKEIIGFDVVRTGAKTTDSADKILAEILNRTGIRRENLSLIVSTGYGRVSIPFADKNVTEISCHGKGAHFLNPDVRTILDIGGQDSKAIRLNESGEVIDFVMNDKCAAGTGRFLEMMARTLELDISELGPVSLNWKENIDISSMCSVFAESEVISLIALNKEKPDIAHGVHKAIAGKAMTLLRKVGLTPGFMMTGGVAKNPGVVAVLEEILGQKLFISEEPEIVGAIGAALYGLESLCTQPTSSRISET